MAGARGSARLLLGYSHWLAWPVRLSWKVTSGRHLWCAESAWPGGPVTGTVVTPGGGQGIHPVQQSSLAAGVCPGLTLLVQG